MNYSFTYFAFSLILVVCASQKIKRKYEKFYPVSDVSNELADQDLAEGLHSLSSAELQSLSKFIDEQSKSGEGNGFLNTMEDGWNGKATKKKRTLDDLYDELARENAGLDMKSKNPNHVPNDGKCHCTKQEEKDDAVRTKRNSQKVDENGERNVDEYVRELEESFPRDQGDNKLSNTNKVYSNEHIRIKRL